MQLVGLEVAGKRATIILDSPQNRNALSAQLRQELMAALRAALADDGVQVIVLTHTGSVFCAGMDLKEARAAGTPTDDDANLANLVSTIWASGKPVIARLAGPARAGGLGLAAACDLVICAEPVTFAFTEVRIGVVPAIISVLTRRRMPAYAMAELSLTGETFSARRAAELGLVNSAVPADQLDAEVDRFIAMVTLGAPGALAATKAMLREPLTDDLAAELEDRADLSARFFAGEEGREGMSAFLEKRPPRWVS